VTKVKKSSRKSNACVCIQGYSTNCRTRIISLSLFFYRSISISSYILRTEKNKRVRPTCLARGEECRGTCGRPQRYSLHASPVQRVTPSLPHSLPKSFYSAEHKYKSTLKSKRYISSWHVVYMLCRILLGKWTERMKKAERYRNYGTGVLLGFLALLPNAPPAPQVTLRRY